MKRDPIAEIRRANARVAINKAGGAGVVSKLMGHKNASFLTQQVGPSPTRNVTESTARQLEAALGLEVGSLDREIGSTAPPPIQHIPHTVSAKALPTELVASVIRMVGQVAEGEKVNLAPAKFADVVALAYVDSMEHQGAARVEHITALVRLLK